MQSRFIYEKVNSQSIEPWKDKNQDIEVEFDAAGNVTGPIVAGLTAVRRLRRVKTIV